MGEKPDFFFPPSLQPQRDNFVNLWFCVTKILFMITLIVARFAMFRLESVLNEI